ncbi:unnamed protein product [Clavelina lepadiformis]|uniref:G-protein coupled receptors family 1 profile domain-containing protein n=1 Tax=Clavelina lepadiformis TaxID=159417 RepID=A0ABP0GFT8_CLALP
MNCTCDEGQFTCGCFTSTVPSCDKNRGGCIPLEKVNNGKHDCADNTDEPLILSLQNLQCGSCDLSVYRLNNKTDCEIIGFPTCDNSTCFSIASVECIEYNCTKTQTICTSFCPSESSSVNCTNLLQCSDQSTILSYNFCDGKAECFDKSDEVLFNPGFKCSSKVSPSKCVLPQWNLYDSVAQCYDQSDICFGDDDSFNCFRCLDRRLIISANQVCDDVIDCYDLSDECLCPNNNLSICATVFANLEPSKLQCNMHQLNCSSSKLLIPDVICNEKIECENAVDEENCVHVLTTVSSTIRCRSKSGDVNAKRCDGRPECSNFQDECSCDNSPEFCNDTCSSYFPMGDRYCDGFVDQAWVYLNDTTCKQGFDELYCPKRFYCKAGKKVSIDVIQTCDGKVDCDNGLDELAENCSNRRFYCQSRSGGLISIPRSLIFDGKRDCIDGTDECPIDNADNVFSSFTEMIASLPLRIWFWGVACVTISGNFYVFTTTLKTLFKKNLSDVTRCNHILVLNLAFADLLMGIYLLIICIKSIEYSGSYCFFDFQWRTSWLCIAVGSLAFISSETSCFVMAIITAFRLYNLYRPFQARTSSTNVWKVSVVFAWILSVLIVIFPSLLSDYFIHSVWFPNPILKAETVTDNNVIEFACRLASLTNTTIEQSGNTWLSAKTFLQSKHPSLAPKGEVGYFGETSVCMPRFYTSYGDRGWVFSTMLITLNFLCFVFVVISYALIYKKTSNRPIETSNTQKQARKLQNRLARLIFTDFLCWIPVCLMAYLKLAGVYLSPDVYAISAGVLLPINSALNPLLYSPFMDKLLQGLLKKCRAILPKSE